MIAVEWISQPPVFVTSWFEAFMFAVALPSLIVLVVSVSMGAWRYWKVTECHVAACHKHQWKRVPGTDHVCCKKHLKLITGRGEPSHAQVVEDHKAARTAAARKL